MGPDWTCIYTNDEWKCALFEHDNGALVLSSSMGQGPLGEVNLRLKPEDKAGLLANPHELFYLAFWATENPEQFAEQMVFPGEEPSEALRNNGESA